MFEKKYFLPILSLLLGLPNFLHFNLTPNLYQKFSYEEFDENLQGIQSVAQLIDSVDKKVALNRISLSSVEYGEIAVDYTKRKFVWGNTFYRLDQNWITALSGRFIWQDLAMITEPDEIIKHPSALCSQQGMVLMEIFKRKGIPYRLNGFANMDNKGKTLGGHFAVEGFFGDDWYYFDPTFEPTMRGEERKQSNWMCDRKVFASHFKDSILFYNLIKTVIISAPNYEPAKNSHLFHKVTFVLSKTLWILPLLLLGLLILKKKYRFVG